MDQATMRIEECARYLGIGRTAAYAAVKNGELPTIKIGGLRLVSKPALQKMLEEAGNKSGSSK